MRGTLSDMCTAGVEDDEGAIVVAMDGVVELVSAGEDVVGAEADPESFAASVPAMSRASTASNQ